MSPAPPKCNMNPKDIMNKIYEIAAIVQTLRTLINQLNAMCLQSAFRYLFGLLFYFAPHLNPYVWADAYEEAMKHREEQERAQKADKARASEAKTTGRDTVSSSGVDGTSEQQVDGTSEQQNQPGQEMTASSE